MGNFIVGYNFSTYTPSAANEDTDYPIANLYNYSHLKRHFRTLSSTQSMIILDQGATNTLKSIVINDPNFTTCIIKGGADTSVGSFSTQISIPLDERVNRYKVYHPLPVDYRYIGIQLPAAMTITDTNVVYKIGTITLLDTEATVSHMPYEYEYSAEEAIKTNNMDGGWFEDVRLGDHVWEGTLSYRQGVANLTESQFWTLNTMRRNQDIAFYEGDTADKSKVYICRRRSVVSVSRSEGGLYTPKSITFKELL